MKQQYVFSLSLEYADETSVEFDVVIEGGEYDVRPLVYMIARGTLMASVASRITAYDSEGFDVCQYIK